MYVPMRQFKSANELQHTRLVSVALVRRFFPAPKCTNECFHKIRLPGAGAKNKFRQMSVQTHTNTCKCKYVPRYIDYNTCAVESIYKHMPIHMYLYMYGCLHVYKYRYA